MAWALIFLGIVSASTAGTEGAALSREAPAVESAAHEEAPLAEPASGPRPGAVGISLARAVATALDRNFGILTAGDGVAAAKLERGLRPGERVALRDPSTPSSDFGSGASPQ